MIGFVAFSSFCSSLTIDILHLPLCAVELFYLPLFLFYRKKIQIPQDEFARLLLFIVLGIAIGGLNTIFSIADILPIARCFFWGGLGFLIAKNNNLLDLDKLYIFLLGVICGDCYNCFFRMNQMFTSLEDKQYAVDINIVFSVLWLVVVVLNKNTLHFVLALIFVPIVSFLSISRGVFSFFMAGLILSIILKFKNNPKKIISIIFFVALISVLAYHVYISIEDNVLDVSTSIHMRLYTKMENIGDNDADSNRFAAYIYIFAHFYRYILPRGFLGKSFFDFKDGYFDEMYAWDSAYAELLYTFGFVLFLPMVFFYISRGRILYSKYRKEDIESGMFFTILVVVFYQLFFTYGIIRSPFTVTSFGLVLGHILRLANTKKLYS